MQFTPTRSRELIRQAALGAALLTIVSAAAAGDSPLLSFPESPAWQQGRAFVAAFNDGERLALARFLQEHLSTSAIRQEGIEQRVDELVRLRRELGEVEALEVSGVSHVAVVNVRGQSGPADADVVVVVSTDDPAKLDQLHLFRVPVEQADAAGALR